MKIAVVGTGYVGLVTGTCFAEKGHEVICVDIDVAKVEAMRAGQVPIYEPGLEEIFERNIKEGRLTFTTDLSDAAQAKVIFLALPTPQGEDGSADLSYVEGVASKLGPLLQNYTVVVNKSTVPVGTAQRVTDILAKQATAEFDVVSNPEFLREGQAVQDFLHPERVVVGSKAQKAADIMQRLYEPFVRRNPEGRILHMDTASAELTKYAANALLATKISFMNGLTELAEKVGADIGQIRRGIGSDSRIGYQFLYPGPGYGGSCFPKDTHALLHIGEQQGLTIDIVQATIAVNERQKQVLAQKVMNYLGEDLHSKRLALWGLAFKDNTDDVRESPALTTIEILTAAGATIVAFDPQAMENTKRALPDNTTIEYVDSPEKAIDGADALIIATNWNEFTSPDFDEMKQLLKAPVIFDGRNIYGLADMTNAGFHYESIGRPIVDGDVS